MRTRLAEIQQRFAEALLSPDQVDATLPLFAGNPELARERFAIYRGNLQALWLQSCAGAFPVLQLLVGEDFFRDLSRMYGLTHPSRSGNLAEFGQNLPAWLRTLDNCAGYPFLGDLAQLEWLVHCAYFSALQPAVTPEQMARIPASALSGLRFVLQPGCALLTSDWAVDAIWQGHQQTSSHLPADIDCASHCLVWRESGVWEVRVSHLPEASYLALHHLKQGSELGTAIDAALQLDPLFDLSAALRDWFDKKLFISLSL